MQARTPILSIVIPSYNSEKYCAACFDSILEGTVTDRYEVVVVDDGSTDGSPAIVASYCGRHPQFHAVRQDNAGVSVARRQGYAVAQGAYIWFVDSDDYLERGAVDRMVETIENFPYADTFAAPVRMRDEDSGREWVKPYAAAPEETLSGKEYLRRQPVSVCPVQFVFKRELFENPWIYFPEGVRHEDEYFCRTLQYFSRTVRVLDTPLYVYRQWGGSFMNSASDRSMCDMVEVYRHLKAFIAQGADAADRDWLRADAFSFLMGTHFWHLDSLTTEAFRSFREKNIAFIRQEFAANKHLLSRKDRVLGHFVLNRPALFAEAMRLKRRFA